jgi:hypothetical protein
MLMLLVFPQDKENGHLVKILKIAGKENGNLVSDMGAVYIKII